MNQALLLRIASATAFFYHGAAITFAAFGGPGPEKFAHFMHMPEIAGYLVGLAQLAGGLAMLTGVFIRLGALCLIIVMLGAIFMVHLQHGFDITHGGIEYALTQLLVAFAIIVDRAGSLLVGGLTTGIVAEVIIRAGNKTLSRLTSHPEARCDAVNFRVAASFLPTIRPESRQRR